jgi:outer membrane cobalamin receptor
MKHALRLTILLPFFIILPTLLYAQHSGIRGTVSEQGSGDLLPFVNIGVKGQAVGTYSDSNGSYQLYLPKGEYDLMITSVGYETANQHIRIDGKRVQVIDFELKSTTKELGTVVVSGSKYAQKIEESVASIEVLKSKDIQISNPSSVDKVIDKIPGITIVDNEPQIRGGSGFSSGLGSRVMVMVDDIPILRGDAGRPSWGFLPVDDIEQVEVVKGASSVVYGSSAITGAINIRTAYPKATPETKVNSYLGIYSKPSRRYATSWSGMNPLIFGLSVSHLQKINNVDLSVGANYYSDRGYIGGTPEPAADTAFNRGEFAKRAKVYFNTRVRDRKIEGLTYGINGTFMYSESAEAYFWYDADTNIYRSYPGALSHFKEFTFYVDPYIKYYNKRGNVHSLKNRVYYGNTDANNNQSNRYLTLYNEYQYTHKFKKLGNMMLVTGIMSTYSYSYGQVFSGILAPDGTTTANEPGSYNSENLAVYAQVEKKFFNRLTILLGGRWEYYQVAGYTENKPIFRTGFNLQATKSTFIRASVGQGYRVPSIGERYITTNSGGFGFYPNPDLQSETSISYEVGVKQIFRIGKFIGMVDLSGFLENYDNYVEFNFGIWGNGLVTKSIGFKFLNTGPARIYGADLTVGGEGKVFRNLEMSILFGFTYSVPTALDPDLVYYTHTETSAGKVREYTYNNTSTDTDGNILKYRMQQIGKSDIQLTYKKRLSAGLSGRYYGYMKNIDVFLYQLDQPKAMHSGVVKYREEHHDGNFIVDMRVGYVVKDFKFSVLINNVFNTEYSLRPITIEAPRTTSLQVILSI